MVCFAEGDDMGVMDWFVIKSREERAADERRYKRFAFPYGEAQRKEIERLISGLMPSEPSDTAMAVYLMGREGYLGSYKMDEEDRAARSEEEKRAGCIRILKRQLQGRHKKLLPYYMALILADADIDEELRYPDEEELRKRAEELGKELG